MPDVPKCGGLSESRKIAHLAEIYYIPFAPHLVSSPLAHDGDLPCLRHGAELLVLEWHALEEREAWDSYVHVPDGTRSIVRGRPYRPAGRAGHRRRARHGGRPPERRAGLRRLCLRPARSGTP